MPSRGKNKHILSIYLPFSLQTKLKNPYFGAKKEVKKRENFLFQPKVPQTQ